MGMSWVPEQPTLASLYYTTLRSRQAQSGVITATGQLSTDLR
jgi:hypothetical protein